MKRVLFDENMPRNLRRDLPEFEVKTVQEQGWAGVMNGALLRLAARDFDVLLTVDQRMRYQQNTTRLQIAVVVIETIDTTLGNLRRLLPQIRDAISTAEPATVAVVSPRA